MMADLLEVTTAEKIAELKRELEMRYRVYGRSHPGNATRKMTRVQQRQVDIMAAILMDYETMAEMQANRGYNLGGSNGG